MSRREEFSDEIKSESQNKVKETLKRSFCTVTNLPFENFSYFYSQLAKEIDEMQDAAQLTSIFEKMIEKLQSEDEVYMLLRFAKECFLIDKQIFDQLKELAEKRAFAILKEDLII